MIVRLSTALLLTLASVTACRPSGPGAGSEQAATCDTTAARGIAERMGLALKKVSLLAPDSIIEREVQEAYGELVTPTLLDGWRSAPARAPGRTVSSPWPAAIEVDGVHPEPDGACRVTGRILFATSADTTPRTMALPSQVVSLRVVDADGWRVDAFAANDGGGSLDPTSATAAADVVLRYYRAIGDGRYERAWALWGDDGSASGQTLADFAHGFDDTERTAVDIGTPGRVEGAAGSRYVEIPVVVRAVTKAGASQRFEGTYTMRRVVVDGATPTQRAWHIYAANLHPMEP